VFQWFTRVDTGQKRKRSWFPRRLVKKYGYLDDHPWIIQRRGNAADLAADSSAAGLAGAA
jgi:hypothetical protein